MGKIFTVMGKSATGKDTVYKKLLEKGKGRYSNIVLYTTRPIRSGEKEGIEYHFVSIPKMEEMRDAGKIIEIRCYNTVYGPWYYFTADDGQIELKDHDYMMITTLAGYESISNYFGTENVVPIYIEIDNYTRLLRAVNREGAQGEPNFSEVCRRYLADEEDFSEAELKRLGVNKRFINDDLDNCLKEIEDWISK